MAHPKDIKQKIELIRQSYIESLDEKLQHINSAWQSLNEEWNEETYESLYLVLHSLAGSAETFGFAKLTVCARAVIDYFKDSNIKALKQPLKELPELGSYIQKVQELLEQYKK